MKQKDLLELEKRKKWDESLPTIYLHEKESKELEIAEKSGFTKIDDIDEFMKSLYSKFYMIFFLLPAFNEEESISNTLQGIHLEMKKIKNITDEKYQNYKIIVCNNNSSDETEKISEKNGAIIVTEKTMGYGYTLMKGIDYIQKNYKNISDEEKILIFMDSDGQDCEKNISQHLENLKTVDFSIASRVGKKTNATSSVHSFVNKLFGFLLKWRTGKKFTDLGPFRVLTMKTFLLLQMKELTYGWTAEMQKHIALQNISYIEFFSSPKQRFAGISKVSGSAIMKQIRIGLQIIWVIIK